MDIVVWLRSLGLGKYEAAFRANEIDETVLPNLTAEDLKDLGVSIVGRMGLMLVLTSCLPVSSRNILVACRLGHREARSHTRRNTTFGYKACLHLYFNHLQRRSV